VQEEVSRWNSPEYLGRPGMAHWNRMALVGQWVVGKGSSVQQALISVMIRIANVFVGETLH
jgi:hypothetical protein